jgi:hypothetical protein
MPWKANDHATARSGGHHSVLRCRFIDRIPIFAH